VASVWDADRHSQVIEVAAGADVSHGKNWYGGGASGYDYNVGGMRTVSLWAKSSSGWDMVAVTVERTVAFAHP
jgi:hypothetical protein